MHRHPERLHLAAWAGPERGYRPPTPHPGLEEPVSRSRHYRIPPEGPWTPHRYVDAVRCQLSEDLQRQIDKQNAKIARRPPRAQGRYSEPGRSVPKRVRFLLPTLRRDRDELDNVAWEFAKLSIRDPYAGPDGRRCSRCVQKLRQGMYGP